MEAYERATVADAFEERGYAAGEVILREGEPGETFYLLVAGTAAATKAGPGGKRTLLEYKEGDYFGELALLNNRCMRALPPPQPSPSSLSDHPSPRTPHPSPVTPYPAPLPLRPRAASVECVTDCTCVHLGRAAFERILGPVIHILKRNAENYKSYEDCQ